MVSADIQVSVPERWMVDYLADHLRERDVTDGKLLGSACVPEALREAYKEGHVLGVALVGDTPMACFGVQLCPERSTVLAPSYFCWLMGTDVIAQSGFGGIKKSLYDIQKIMKTFHHLFTFVFDDNPRAVRYIQALGFKKGVEQMRFGTRTASYWERIG